MAKVPIESKSYAVTVKSGTTPSTATESRSSEFNRFKPPAATRVDLPKSELDERRRHNDEEVPA